MGVEAFLAPLCRVLFAVERSAWSGHIELRAGGACAVLGLRRGRLSSIDGVEAPPLGDLLRTQGSLHDGHEPGERPGVRIGAALIASGRASGAEVRGALQRQLEQRLFCVVRRAPRVHTLHARELGPPPSYSLPPSGALFRAVLALASELGGAREARNARDARGAGEAKMAAARALTPFGVRWLACSAPELRQLIASGIGLSPLAANARERESDLQASVAYGESPASRRQLRVCLQWLGLLDAQPSSPSPGRSGYALLLRKRRELARATPARALLELRAEGDHPRRALRRLAAKLHPDRFLHAGEGLRAMASDTLRAVIEAERVLEAASHVSPP